MYLDPRKGWQTKKKEAGFRKLLMKSIVWSGAWRIEGEKRGGGERKEQRALSDADITYITLKGLYQDLVFYIYRYGRVTKFQSWKVLKT